MTIYNLVSLVGLFVLLGIAWLISTDRRNINFRVVILGLILQFAFAAFIFIVPAGTSFFLFINDLVVKVLDSASAGARFLFGRLAVSPGQPNNHGESSLGFFLAFQVFPAIIFFSALMSILYYYRIMPTVIRGFSYVFSRLMRVSGAESLVAASNIFVGIESALTVRPYLGEMTRSEFCTVLTVGMATVSSSVLAIYIFSLQNVFPTIAGHLISASILSAPAALVLSKIILPESEVPKTLGVQIKPSHENGGTLFESIINGSNNGVKLIVGIAALLIAVLGLVSLADLVIGAIGGKINYLTGMNIDWSLQALLGYLFYPFTVLIGVPIADAFHISKIIGERVVVTEVVSYQDLANAIKLGVLSDQRSVVVATYALCGFAHLASMAIFVGGVSALAPEKKGVIAGVGFRALIAATLACMVTACVAGIFIYRDSALIVK